MNSKIRATRRRNALANICGSNGTKEADAFHDGGLRAGNLVNFVQKIVQLAVDGGQED